MKVLTRVLIVGGLALAGSMPAGVAWAHQGQSTPPAKQAPPPSQPPATQPAPATTQPQTSSTTPTQNGAQTQKTDPPPADPQVPTPDLARIRKGLAVEPIIKLDEDRLRFYLQIIAKQPKFEDFVKGYDLMNGATRRGNPMTHQEFLAMVTPREMVSTAGIQPVEMLQFAITNWLGQALIKKALTEIGNAKTQAEIDEIRARIDRELAALTGKGGS